MGGYGSGRNYRGNVKATVEDCYSIDANVFARGGYWNPSGLGFGILRWTRSGSQTGVCSFNVHIDDAHSSITFYYTYNGEKHPATKVNLSWYTPGFGGRRYFFLCPHCGRRMRTLHIKCGEIACRICHNLTYTSCKENHRFDSLFKNIARHDNSSSWQDYKQSFNRRVKNQR